MRWTRLRLSEGPTRFLAAQNTRAFVLAIVAGWLTWPLQSLAPETGLDPSWVVALHLANRAGLQFGKDIVFTYGPLGFLTMPRLLFGAQAAASLAFFAVVHLALSATILIAFRENFSLKVAVPSTLILLTLVSPIFERNLTLILLVIVSIWCVWIVRGVVDVRAQSALAALISVLCGISLLMKVSIGLSMLGIAALTLGYAYRRKQRQLAFFSFVGLSIFFLAWMASGQDLRNLGGFARYSIESAAGYSEAMGTEDPDRAWERIGALIVLSASALIGWSSVRKLALGQRVVLALLGAIFSFSLLKHGFVRHDGHSHGFFAAFALTPIAFRLIPEDKTLGREKRAIWTVIALIPTLLMIGATIDVSRELNPFISARTALTQFLSVVREESRHQQIESTRSHMRTLYGLDPEMLTLASGKTVHVYPWETSLIWAHPEFKWAPLPSFQSYATYTSELDRMNATFLASERGPQVILRQPNIAIDGRSPTFESPAANVAMLCHFREVRATASWQLLVRASNRCGKPKLLSSQVASLGEQVPIPDHPGLLIAKVKVLDESLAHKLKVFLYKSEHAFVTVSSTQVNRLVMDTSRNGLLLRVPQDSNHAPPFNFAQTAETMRISFASTRFLQPEFRIAFSFYSIPITNQ